MLDGSNQIAACRIPSPRQHANSTDWYIDLLQEPYAAANGHCAAAENLVGYSTAQPSLFKYNQFEPIKDLKLLIRDYPTIAKNALTILVNISDDAEVLEKLSTDDDFLKVMLRRVTVRQRCSNKSQNRPNHFQRTGQERTQCQRTMHAARQHG